MVNLCDLGYKATLSEQRAKTCQEKRDCYRFHSLKFFGCLSSNPRNHWQLKRLEVVAINRSDVTLNRNGGRLLVNEPH